MIHIVESLDRGAVENWLLRMLRHARRRGMELDWTFYCQLEREGALDAAARELGARVIRSPVPIGMKASFARALRAELQAGGYDVLHAHHDLVSGVYLAASAGLPIRRRIVHVHNADEAVLTNSRAKQRLFRPALRQLCLSLADRIVGISRHTLEMFLHGRQPRPERDVVHYYGVDATPFRHAAGDRASFRHALGLPSDAPILLFAGRMVYEKNPLFAVEVLLELRRLEPRAVAVFAGSGAQSAPCRERVRELGIEPHVRMLGWRGDVAEIMMCCDWFIHPRLEHPRPEQPMEGLGLAVVEAQLAGLRLLLSRALAPDALLPNARVAQLGLADGPAAWARAAVALGTQPATPAAAALEALGRSPFDMDFALADLLRLHAEGTPA